MPIKKYNWETEEEKKECRKKYDREQKFYKYWRDKYKIIVKPEQVETFMKNTSIIDFSKEAFNETKKAVIQLANSEGLHSHAESIRIRNSNSS